MQSYTSRAAHRQGLKSKQQAPQRGLGGYKSAHHGYGTSEASDPENREEPIAQLGAGPGQLRGKHLGGSPQKPFKKS